MRPDAINYLSLARKAGRIEVGEEPAGAAARAGHARLVLVAGDAPDSTRRRAKSFVAGTDQQMVILPFTKDEMGAALGRSVVALAAMTDPAMALAFLKALDDPARYGEAIASLTVKAERMRRHQLEQKAHERNLRTGKVRREKEPDTPRKKQPEQPAEADRKSRAESRPEKNRAEYSQGKSGFSGKTRGDNRYNAYGDRNPRRQTEEDKARSKKAEYRSGTDSHERHGSGKWDGRGERAGKPYAAKSGYAARPGGQQKTDYRKNSGKSTGQKYATGNKVAGRKPGRKTHGGAV